MNGSQKHQRHITFGSDAPAFDGARMMVDFVALVDGASVSCSISAEALEDHFGAQSSLESELLQAFERGRARIHEAATAALKETDGRSVVLHSGLFRIAAS
jgi:hypothetical protein